MISSKKGQLMFSSITPMYDNSELMNAIFEAIGTEADTSVELGDEILREIFPQTAISWGLGIWEQRLNLITNISESVEKRRRKILTKLQTRSIVTPEKMGYIVKSLTGLATDVNDKVADYTFGITLTSESFDIDIGEIKQEVKRIKPSHLGYSLALETPKTINISMSREYVFNPLNMCGGFICGDGIVISTYGRSYESTMKTHVDYSKNIKNYSLTGEILSGLNAEFEIGITVIGRVYESTESIKAIKEYLYDNQLSKTDGNIIGTIYNSEIKAAGTYNNAINIYDESGNDFTGLFMTGSSELLVSTLGRIYESSDNIETTEKVILDTQLNKSSSTDPIVGSLNSSIIQAISSSEDAIKDYSQAGSILVSENIDSENGYGIVGRTYSCNIDENSSETSAVKEYNQSGEILTSTEVVL